MKRRIITQIVALGMGAVVAGCGEGVLPAEGGVQTFSPLQPAPIVARTIDAPPSDLSPAMRTNYEAILDGFQNNAETLLQRDDIEPRLEQIESVYAATGRYLEMVAIYQADVEKRGLESAAAPSLVWAWMQIGQRKQARDLIDQLLQQHAQKATSWFLDGAYWLPDAQTSSEAAKKTIASWQKTLELDPGFANFKGFNTTILRQQIANLQQRVDNSPLNMAANQQIAAQPQPEAQPEPQPEPAPEETAPPVAEAPPEIAEPEVAEPEAAPEPEVAPEPEAAPEKPQESAGILVAQGQIALSRGNSEQLGQAQDFFSRALALEPDNVGAAVGLFNVRRLQGASNDVLLADLRTLAAHPNLTAQHAYELGMFSVRGIKNNAVALQFFERCQQLDAGYAERAGVPALIQRLRSE